MYVRYPSLYSPDFSSAEHYAFGITTKFDDSSTLLVASRRNSVASSATSGSTVRENSESTACVPPIYDNDLSHAEHDTQDAASDVRSLPFSAALIEMYTANRKKLLANHQKTAASRDFNAALKTAQEEIAQKRARIKADLEKEQAELQWEAETPEGTDFRRQMGRNKA
jgi:histidyl-tRNA synthetase